MALATPSYLIPQSAAHALELDSTSEALTAPVSKRKTDPAGMQSAPIAMTAIASALLAACGGGGGGSEGGAGGGLGGTGFPSAPGFNNFPQANNDNEAARFLLQAQLSATPTEISSAKAQSFAGYLQQEFAKPINTGWSWLEQQGYGANAVLDKNVYNNAIADFAVWRDLISAPDALRKRTALALSEFFVVSHSSMEIDWRGYTMTAFWDILNEHAFGNFRNLLEAVTLSPAMGYFLNTRGNQKEDPARGRQPDENYAREVMQLFTIGLYELNLNGSIKTDSTGKKLETYDSDDVSQLARVFTGYDFDQAYAPSSPNGLQFPDANYKVWAREYARRPMTLNAARHSNLPVSFLKASIPANTAGAAALKTALDELFNHPNVGPFFGRQMIQRLVTSNPSPEYVARVASAFNNNGAGVRGDMKAVWVAILLDDEARNPATLANNSFGKLREPMLRFVQWARSFRAYPEFGTWKLFDLSDSSDSLGQSPLRSPSVFNFFRPGYVPPAIGVTAPEFQLVNETTVGGYLNFMQDAIKDGIYTPTKNIAAVEYTNYTLDFVANYDNLVALINNPSPSTAANSEPVARAILTQLNTIMCAGQLQSRSLTIMIDALRDGMVARAVNTGSNAARKREAVCAALLMILACPDYLIQK
ncbi:MAG: DUF1800 domain-containing protein [Brachymonas sp.]|nr:DUF1800 domain-containing protein [Brachymonas sp.]